MYNRRIGLKGNLQGCPIWHVCNNLDGNAWLWDEVVYNLRTLRRVSERFAGSRQYIHEEEKSSFTPSAVSSSIHTCVVTWRTPFPVIPDLNREFYSMYSYLCSEVANGIMLCGIDTLITMGVRIKKYRRCVLADSLSICASRCLT